MIRSAPHALRVLRTRITTTRHRRASPAQRTARGGAKRKMPASPLGVVWFSAAEPPLPAQSAASTAPPTGSSWRTPRSLVREPALVVRNGLGLRVGLRVVPVVELGHVGREPREVDLHAIQLERRAADDRVVDAGVEHPPTGSVDREELVGGVGRDELTTEPPRALLVVPRAVGGVGVVEDPVPTGCRRPAHALSLQVSAVSGDETVEDGPLRTATRCAH